MNSEETQEIVILDTPKNTSNSPNQNLTEKEALKANNQRAVNALRYQKAGATHRARSQYKKGLKQSLQALVDGTYCTLTDGTELTGGDIIALGIFARAMESDKSAKLLANITGDLKESEETENSYEGFIKNVRVKI